MNTFAEIDLKIFHVIHGIAGNHFLDAIGYGVAVYLIFVLGIGIVVISVSHLLGRRIALRATLAALCAFAYNALVGMIVQQSRPYFITDAQPLFFPVSDKSFPSDHAALSFAMAWTIYRVAPLPGKISLVVAALIAISRVYSGVHFPSDVLIGAIVGMLFAEVIHRFDHYYLQKKHPSRL